MLKPDAVFGLDEWVMTDQFDANNHEHRVLRDRIERGNGLAKMPLLGDVRSGLRHCGFEITHDENIELRSKPGPWYYPILGMLRYATCLEDVKTALPMERRIMVPMTDLYYRLLVKLKVVPPEFIDGFEIMKTCTESVARGSQKGVYSSMWVFIAKNKK